MKTTPRRAESRDRDRQRVAAEAVRLLASGAEREVAAARTRAAQRLGVRDEASLPRREEIEQQLRAHLALFRGTRQRAELRRRREAALPAMSLLAAFAPRLVGAVLAGTADAHSPVELLLHADEPEAVARLLIEHGIPAEPRWRRMRLDRVRTVEVPLYAFLADELPFELTVLPASALRQAPLDGDGHALARAGRADVEALLAASPD